jgi:hypothetical protein
MGSRGRAGKRAWRATRRSSTRALVSPTSSPSCPRASCRLRRPRSPARRPPTLRPIASSSPTTAAPLLSAGSPTRSCRVLPSSLLSPVFSHRTSKCFLNLFLRLVRNCINSFICYVCIGIATGIRGFSLSEESRAAVRAATRPGVSPTSTVWGDEWGQEQGNQMRQHMLAAAMGERHLSA